MIELEIPLEPRKKWFIYLNLLSQLVGISEFHQHCLILRDSQRACPRRKRGTFYYFREVVFPEGWGTDGDIKCEKP